jgi:hypothetical protein
MQPQGLEALMQSQPMPQMDNPRLAAATDVVSSDAEEQILDPRTLAMLKYKDALQAMQAADQMLAAAQPAPTAPTVAERTKLAAEQGIAGLAQRLAPRVQQQGSQMAAQQGAGGLPQLSAPNMAGMAGGGIVGYAPGGAVNPAPTPTKVVPRPIPMGQPNVEAQAAMADAVARYIYNYKNMRASMEAATDPQQKAEIAQILREMQQTYSPDIVAEAHMKMSQQSGMADGGAVRGFAEGRKVEGAPPVGFTPTLPREGQPMSLEELIAEAARYDRIEAQAERAREAARNEAEGLPVYGAQPAIGSAYIDPETGEPMPIGERFAMLFSALSDPKGREGQYQPGKTSSPPPPTDQPAQEVSTNGSTINLSSLDRDRQERSSPRVTSETPENAGLASLIAYVDSQTGTPTATQSDFDRRVEQATLNRLEGALDYDPEKTRLEEEERARAAYGVPAALTELLRARSAALDAPLYTPEEERNRKISALLSGLASSNLIAQSGPAASRAIMGIEDEVRGDARTRAEKQFDLAASLIEQERAAGQNVYTAGREAISRAETGANQAMQSAVARLNSLREVGAAQTLQQQQMQFDTIKAQIEAAAEQQRLGRYDAQNNAALAATFENVLQNAETTKVTLLQTLAATPEENSQPIQDAIDAIDLELGAIRVRFNELTGVRAAPIETPTPTGEFDLTPEAADVFSRYRQL